MEAYLEDNRPTLDEVCKEYDKCTECPAYEFCHSKVVAEFHRFSSTAYELGDTPGTTTQYR